MVTVTNLGPESSHFYAWAKVGDPNLLVDTSSICERAGQEINCPLGMLSANESATFTFTCQFFEPAIQGGALVIVRADTGWASTNVPLVTVTEGPGYFHFPLPNLGLQPTSMPETGGTLPLKILRSGGAIGQVTVDYEAVGQSALENVDFVEARGTLVFTNGQTEESITLQALPDTEPECNETILVRLSNPTGGAVLAPPLGPYPPSVFEAEIVDDDIRPRGAIECASCYPGYPWHTVPQGGDGASMSHDGQRLAFESGSTDFVATPDLNGALDVFLRDFQTGQTTLVSVNRDGSGAGNGPSYQARLSLDGHWVVFNSRATDLVTNETSGQGDVFVRDLMSGTTRLVSVSTNAARGGNGPSYLFGGQPISSNGAWIVFLSHATDMTPLLGKYDNILAYHVPSGETHLVTSALPGTGGANGFSTPIEMSDDGRYVLFSSEANNLVEGDLGNGWFVRDLITSQTTKLDSSWGIPSQISGDGRFILSTTLLTVFRQDWQLGTADTVVQGEAINVVAAIMSANGRFVAFANDTNIFLRDMLAGTTNRVTERCTGGPSVYGAYTYDSGVQGISDDGRYVVFLAPGIDLAPGTGSRYTPDLFRRDLVTGTTELLTMNYQLTGETDDWRTGPSVSHRVTGISGDGRVVAFSSTAVGLREDANGVPDVFVWREYPPGPVADLRMTTKELSHASNIVVISISVTNFGPDKATGVYVTNSFPPGIQPLLATSPTGSCTVQAGSVVCELPDLDVRSGATIQVTAFSTISEQAFILARASGIAYDPIAWNSSSILPPLVVQPGAAVPAPPSGGLSILAYEPLLIVRWSNSPAGFVLEQTPSLAPPQWTPAQPIIDDGSISTWFGSAPQQQFFRLRQP